MCRSPISSRQAEKGKDICYGFHRKREYATRYVAMSALAMYYKELCKHQATLHFNVACRKVNLTLWSDFLTRRLGHAPLVSASAGAYY